ncbi:hypothetical protein SEA_FANCYPANTS_42 [Mycobacterium phage Fancypants]|uniref:Helix-turn-helix DNA binding domain protein n=1 Tax=Mycobacterium phage Fancypants TaxID=2530128 RepID=A0A481VUH1_9CAUD|nr:HTH DNA binding protein [Mycobacterium phage Fancypants]QBI97380.1 hypothetical protein SEA_FANCYPANTS_42 [Mycobacterium phage Fancypants]
MARTLGVVPEPERSNLLEALKEAERHREWADQIVRLAVRAAAAAGGSVREIAVLTGKSTNTIQRWLKEQ